MLMAQAFGQKGKTVEPSPRDMAFRGSFRPAIPRLVPVGTKMPSLAESPSDAYSPPTTPEAPDSAGSLAANAVSQIAARKVRPELKGGCGETSLESVASSSSDSPEWTPRDTPRDGSVSYSPPQQVKDGGNHRVPVTEMVPMKSGLRSGSSSARGCLSPLRTPRDAPVPPRRHPGGQRAAPSPQRFDVFTPRVPPTPGMAEGSPWQDPFYTDPGPWRGPEPQPDEHSPTLDRHGLPNYPAGQTPPGYAGSGRRSLVHKDLDARPRQILVDVTAKQREHKQRPLLVPVSPEAAGPASTPHRFHTDPYLASTPQKQPRQYIRGGGAGGLPRSSSNGASPFYTEPAGRLPRSPSSGHIHLGSAAGAGALPRRSVDQGGAESDSLRSNDSFNSRRSKSAAPRLSPDKVSAARAELEEACEEFRASAEEVRRREQQLKRVERLAGGRGKERAGAVPMESHSREPHSRVRGDGGSGGGRIASAGCGPPGGSSGGGTSGGGSAVVVVGYPQPPQPPVLTRRGGSARDLDEDAEARLERQMRRDAEARMDRQMQKAAEKELRLERKMRRRAEEDARAVWQNTMLVAAAVTLCVFSVLVLGVTLAMRR